jgi:hypothetical protein
MAIPSIYTKKWVQGLVVAFGIAAFLFLGWRAFFIWQHQKDHNKTCSFILGAIWVIGIPLWFVFEHSFLFGSYGDITQFDQCKRVQDLASKVWAAGVVILAAAASGAFPK